MTKIVRFPAGGRVFPASADFANLREASYTLDKMTTQVESAQKIEAQFRVAEWLVEPSLNRVTRDGASVQLELKAMDVLLCLSGRPGELVEKRELLDHVWQTEYVSDNTLTRRIAELREALGDDARNPRYIETIPKRGYRLIAEVAFFDEPSEGRESSRGGLAISGSRIVHRSRHRQLLRPGTRDRVALAQDHRSPASRGHRPFRSRQELAAAGRSHRSRAAGLARGDLPSG